MAERKSTEKVKRNLTIMRYWDNGYTVRAIAGIVHVSPAMVHRIIKRYREKRLQGN